MYVSHQQFTLCTVDCGSLTASPEWLKCKKTPITGCLQCCQFDMGNEKKGHSVKTSLALVYPTKMKPWSCLYLNWGWLSVTAPFCKPLKTPWKLRRENIPLPNVKKHSNNFICAKCHSSTMLLPKQMWDIADTQLPSRESDVLSSSDHNKDDSHKLVNWRGGGLMAGINGHQPCGFDCSLLIRDNYTFSQVEGTFILLLFMLTVVVSKTCLEQTRWALCHFFFSLQYPCSSIYCFMVKYSCSPQDGFCVTKPFTGGLHVPVFLHVWCGELRSKVVYVSARCEPFIVSTIWSWSPFFLKLPIWQSSTSNEVLASDSLLYNIHLSDMVQKNQT